MTPEPVPPPSVRDIVIRAAIQASPRFAGSMEVVFEGVKARRRARVEEAMSELNEVGRDEVVQRIVDREDIEVMVQRMMQAAEDSTLASKRRLLGRIVAQAVLDDAKVDRGQLLLGILAQLEAPHARCLEEVARAEDEADALGERGKAARGAEQELAQRIIEAGRRQDPLVLHQLEAWGLLTANVTWDGTSLLTGLTVSGQELLAELRTAGLNQDL